MEYIAVFALGAVVGSFLNVCVYRLPLGRSIVAPRSACPFCEGLIPWYCNIPIVSYFFLKGRCRDCSRPIPVRYLIVEVVTALAATLLFYHYSISAAFFVYFLFTCALITVVFIDIEHQEIPDVISIPGMFAGLVMYTFFLHGGSRGAAGAFFGSMLGLLAGGGSMFILGWAGELIFGKEALGGGDVKLMAMIGAFIGWKLVLLTFFLAPLFGSVAGIIMKFKLGKEEIAYAPYLSLSALISLLYGDNILGFLFGAY